MLVHDPAAVEPVGHEVLVQLTPYDDDVYTKPCPAQLLFIPNVHAAR